MEIQFALEIITLAFSIIVIGIMAHWAGGSANPEKIMDYLKRSK